jgi:hypothetical protein
MTQSEATTGTATTARSITAKVLNDTITAKVSASETTLQSAIGAEQSARESGDAAINALIGAANGIAPLDADAKIPVANLPSNIGGGGGKRYAQIVVGNTSAGYTAADVDILVDGTNVSNDLISAITSHVNDILLLPGRYDIPQNLALGNATTIRGSGNAASYMTRSQLYGAASATLNVRFENKISNVMLSKWTLTGGGVYDGCAFDGAYGIFRQIINSAIDARDSYTCTSSGAMFCNNVTASGRPGTGTITFSGQTIGGVISGNYFGAFGGIVLSSANHLSISNNVFKNIGASGGTAITLTNSNRCAITGNVSVGPLYDKGVILNTSSNNTIVGNVFYNQDRTTYTQISIGSGSNYNTVVGNQASIVNSGTGNIVGSNY